MDLRKSDRKIQMLIADGIFVTESLSPFMAINNEYLKFKARILRFIDMFPGKQWHVRQSSGPGGVARAAEETQEGEVNDRGCYEASEISVEEISLMVARDRKSVV